MGSEGQQWGMVDGSSWGGGGGGGRITVGYGGWDSSGVMVDGSSPGG